MVSNRRASTRQSARTLLRSVIVECGHLQNAITPRTRIIGDRFGKLGCYPKHCEFLLCESGGVNSDVRGQMSASPDSRQRPIRSMTAYCATVRGQAISRQLTRMWTTHGVRNWESMDASAFVVTYLVNPSIGRPDRPSTIGNVSSEP